MVALAALAALAAPRAARSAGAPATAPAGAASRAAAPGDETAERTVPRKSGQSPESRRLGEKDGDLGGWVRTVAALAAVVVLIFAARLVLRRLAGGRVGLGGSRAIEVLARANLSARQQLSLVRLGRRLVLIGSSPTGMSCLAEVTDPTEVAELMDELKVSGAGALGRLLSRGQPPDSESAAAEGAPEGRGADGRQTPRPPGNQVSRSVRDLTAKIRSQLPPDEETP